MGMIIINRRDSDKSAITRGSIVPLVTTPRFFLVFLVECSILQRMVDVNNRKLHYMKFSSGSLQGSYTIKHFSRVSR